MLNLQFLWEEERTRRLFRTHLILFFIGGVLASIYALILPQSTAYRLPIILIPTLFTISCIPYYLLLNRPNPGVRFLIFTLQGQLAAAIFMALTGGFLGIVQFAPFMFLLFCVFELGETSTLILGCFSIITFTGIGLWGLLHLQKNLFQEYIYYTGSYILILVIEGRIGKEISLQIEAKQRLEQIDDLKNQFITLTSHYLRTPLTVIKGFSQIIQNSAQGEQRAQVDNLNLAVKQLGLLIEKFLTISEIEKGQAKVSKLPSDLNSLVGNTVNEFQIQARERGVTLDLKTSASPIARFNFDPIKIKEVISSLLDNAIKYNKPGGRVLLTLEDYQKEVLIKVTDTGVGIKRENLRNLFNTFSRGSLEQALRSDKPGVGLSLYLAKLIVEAHRGKISVSSKENIGSTFQFSLPKT